jgi:hypothetical protein
MTAPQTEAASVCYRRSPRATSLAIDSHFLASLRQCNLARGLTDSPLPRCFRSLARVRPPPGLSPSYASVALYDPQYDPQARCGQLADSRSKRPCTLDTACIAGRSILIYLWHARWTTGAFDLRGSLD